jgi:hypothetical protein
MYELDDNFLTEIGIANMSEPAKGKLVAGIQQTISDRVLIKIADQVDEKLIDQLEAINGESPEAAKKWLESNLPNYADSADFKLFSDTVGSDNAIQLFAQSKWFETNLPTFPAIVEQTASEVQDELKTVGKAANSGLEETGE